MHMLSESVICGLHQTSLLKWAQLLDGSKGVLHLCNPLQKEAVYFNSAAVIDKDTAINLLNPLLHEHHAFQYGMLFTLTMLQISHSLPTHSTTTKTHARTHTHKASKKGEI